jgi:hypothetical protein
MYWRMLWISCNVEGVVLRPSGPHSSQKAEYYDSHRVVLCFCCDVKGWNLLLAKGSKAADHCAFKLLELSAA